MATRRICNQCGGALTEERDERHHVWVYCPTCEGGPPVIVHAIGYRRWLDERAVTATV